MPRFRTSPSRIARYFFHHCDRQFRYGSTFKSERADQGVPEAEFDRSPVMKGVLEQGHAWEEEVLERFVGDRARVAPGTGKISDRQWEREATLDLLRQASPGEALYQPTLRTPKLFYRRHGIDPELVAISDCRPDLVEVTEHPEHGRLFRIVDVKRGDVLKPTFQIQVLVYALILQALLDDEGIEGKVDLDEGGVWLGGTAAPEWCDLGPLKPHLFSFLREDLPRILEAPADEVPWHLFFRCEWCDYFEHCRSEMEETNDVSQLRTLTTFGKAFLRDQLDVRSIDGMRRFLEEHTTDEVDQALSASASLAGKRPYLEAQVDALEDGEIELHGGRTHLFPRFTKREVRTYVTLQWEPLGDTIYLAGMRTVAHSDVPPQIANRFTGNARIWVAPAAGETAEVHRAFVEELHDLLETASLLNESTTDFRQKISVTVIVHNNRERDLLERLLLEALDDPMVAQKAMELLLFTASPELLNMGRSTTELPSRPAVAVALEAVGQLFALPVPVAYTLPEALQSLGYDDYERYDTYLFPLGHGIRSDKIHQAWREDDEEARERFVRAVGVYLSAVQRFYDLARSEANDRGLLDSYAEAFELPRVEGIEDPILARLAFFCRYESVSRCRALNDSRMRPLDAQILLGEVHVLEMTRDGGREARVVTDTSDLEESSFTQWLMVPDTHAGRQAARTFPDYYYRRARGVKSQEHRSLVTLTRVETDPAGLVQRVQLDYATRFEGREPQKGERFLLYPRYQDYITDRTIDFLGELDNRPRGLFRELLEDPENGAQPCALPPSVTHELDGAATLETMTPSKGVAFEAITKQRATAIWGPPGTGKTFFLATTIVALADAHRRAGLPFRVLVTGFTHAAIENLLRATQEAAEEAEVDLVVAKGGGWKRGEGESTESGKRAIEAWARGHARYVVGTTAYQMMKENPGTLEFDLVVFDESSQVRVPEAAAPMAFVADRGRIVFAGDDFQLPPIVQGTYSDPESGPALHRSIFEALLQRDEEGVAQSSVVYGLRENFRQNDVLTSYARELLYPGYCCANFKIADRRLDVGQYASDVVIDTLLDPTYPLVVGIIDGVRAAKENPVEADLVGRMVLELREQMLLKGRPVASDEQFWKDGVFVVSPHRAQNAAIRRDLHRRREWDVPPFVDTVDKMQGQEAEVVLVSYGVSDPEFALMEAEFIYSRNRLNVAISRARSKTVLLMSRDLVRGVPGILESPEAATGLAYIRSIIHQLRQDGVTQWFDLPGDHAIEVLRTSVPFGERDPALA